MNDMSEIPADAPEKTLSQLADELEVARRNTAHAREELDRAHAMAKLASETERAAYKAFNDAVAAMKPKRKPSEKKSGEPKAPKASKPKK